LHKIDILEWRKEFSMWPTDGKINFPRFFCLSFCIRHKFSVFFGTWQNSSRYSIFASCHDRFLRKQWWFFCAALAEPVVRVVEREALIFLYKKKSHGVRSSTSSASAGMGGNVLLAWRLPCKKGWVHRAVVLSLPWPAKSISTYLGILSGCHHALPTLRQLLHSDVVINVEFGSRMPGWIPEVTWSMCMGCFMCGGWGYRS
jgi:hypothetical protein